MKLVVCTGGFDPIHRGHISYLTEAARRGDMLIVGLNSDAWLERKKGQVFMPWQERAAILGNMKSVTRVEHFNDSDGSACDLLALMKRQFPYATVIFANGGDRTQDNIPEMSVDGIEFAFGVGGQNKVNSSSWILQEWKTPRIERPWGYYRVLHDVSGTKVKELTVMPGKTLSMQRHANRAEYWHVTHGSCSVFTCMPNGYALPVVLLTEHTQYRIPKNEWHQLNNPYDVPCRIVEIQYGKECVESDIERR